MLADADLPRHVFGLTASFHLFQRGNDLRFRMLASRHPVPLPIYEIVFDFMRFSGGAGQANDRDRDSFLDHQVLAGAVRAADFFRV